MNTAVPASNNILSEDFEPSNATRVSVDSLSSLKVDYTEEWKNIIDDPILEWRHGCPDLDAEGYESPSRESLEAALEIARLLKEENVTPPKRVTPSGDGGICFEYHEGALIVEIDEDGHVEMYRFQGSRLIMREQLL